MTTPTRYYVFSMFFNYDRRGKVAAEALREESITYLKRLFENVAQFACVAKDDNASKPSLILKGYVHLNSTCTPPHMKRWLEKGVFGDVVNLCRLVCVDKQLTTVGRLSNAGNSSAKFTTDPEFVVKLLVDSIEGRDAT